MYTRLWWGKPEGRNDLEALGIVGKIILKWIFIKYDGDVHCISVVQDRHRTAVVNMVIKIRVIWTTGCFVASWGTVGFSRRTLLLRVSHMCGSELYLYLKADDAVYLVDRYRRFRATCCNHFFCILSCKQQVPLKYWPYLPWWPEILSKIVCLMKWS